MPLPYQIATLLYGFNDRDEVLLLERAQEPNRGLWSPCGGKLHTQDGESPWQCARREAEEELGISLKLSELHLTGIVREGFNSFRARRWTAWRCRRPIAKKSGRGSGSIAVASSRRIVIAMLMDG